MEILGAFAGIFCHRVIGAPLRTMTRRGNFGSTAPFSSFFRRIGWTGPTWLVSLGCYYAPVVIVDV
jgi:hypothetical protein